MAQKVVLRMHADANGWLCHDIQQAGRNARQFFVHDCPRRRPYGTALSPGGNFSIHSAIPDDFLQLVDLARQARDGEGRACSPGAFLRVCV